MKWPPFVICCHSLSFAVTRCHSLPFDVPPVSFFKNYHRMMFNKSRITLHSVLVINNIKGATKFYFMRYSRVVIILFKWVFVSLYIYLIFWRTTVSSSCVFCVFCLLCVLDLMSSYKLKNICMTDCVGIRCSLILFSHWFVKTEKFCYKSLIMTLSTKNMLPDRFWVFIKQHL